MAYDDEEMPQLLTELPPGWKPGDMLPPDEGSDDSTQGLLARADSEGRLAPDDQLAAGQQTHRGDSVIVAQSGPAGVDNFDASGGAGLIVEPYFKSTVDNMRKRSPTFDSMLTMLEHSPNGYTLRRAETPWEYPASTPCGFVGGGCWTRVDPNKVVQLRYSIDPAERTEESGPLSQMTVERVLAHEFAHQIAHEREYGWERVDYPENDSVKVENQVMQEIDPSSPDRDPNDNRLFRPGKTYVPTDKPTGRPR